MNNTPNSLVLLERLGRLLQNDAHREGLKPTQWEALRYLARANRFSRNPGAVTSYLGMTKGTVSQTLSALERKGLVKKVAVPTDRRNVAIELTGKGKALLRKDPLESLNAAMEQLSERQRTSLGRGLNDLLGEALDQREGRPFGACRSCRYFQSDVEDGKPHRCGLLDVSLTQAESDFICVEHEHRKR